MANQPATPGGSYPAPQRRNSPVSKAEAQAMLRAVLNLFDQWGLQTNEKLVLLGGPSERTFQKWRAGQIGPLRNDTIFRLGGLLGIHKALRSMFTDVTRACAWIKRANDAFGGK